MRWSCFVLSLLGVCNLCGCNSWGLGEGPDERALRSPVFVPFVAPPPDQGFQLSMVYDAPPQAESLKCQVGKLPGIAVHQINKVLSRQNADVHHMAIIVMPFAEAVLPEGLFDCQDLYLEYPEVMESGIALFGSQNPSFDAILPEGVVAPVPGGIQYMQELHFINVTDETQHVWSKVNAYTIDSTEVTGAMNGFSKNDRKLNIPPHAKHDEWSRCVMTHDIDLLFMTSHTHELAENFTVRLFDGTEVGEQVYENPDWHAPPLKPFTDAPLRIPAGTGFEWTCHYDNVTDHEVNWGLSATDEMCQMIIAFTPGSSDIDCQVVETSSD